MGVPKDELATVSRNDCCKNIVREKRMKEKRKHQAWDFRTWDALVEEGSEGEEEAVQYFNDD